MADYSFDRVYGPGESTSALYDESVRGVVGCFVEGYHGSVFAYGQVRLGWERVSVSFVVEKVDDDGASRGRWRLISRSSMERERERERERKRECGGDRTTFNPPRCGFISCLFSPVAFAFSPQSIVVFISPDDESPRLIILPLSIPAPANTPHLSFVPTKRKTRGRPTLAKRTR
jgi:hypothetical protein